MLVLAPMAVSNASVIPGTFELRQFEAHPMANWQSLDCVSQGQPLLAQSALAIMSRHGAGIAVITNTGVSARDSAMRAAMSERKRTISILYHTKYFGISPENYRNDYARSRAQGAVSQPGALSCGGIVGLLGRMEKVRHWPQLRVDRRAKICLGSPDHGGRDDPGRLTATGWNR